MNLDIAFLIGRILFGGFFLVNALNHFAKNEMLAGYAASKGVPAPKFLVFVSGLFILFGGLGMLLGVYTQWAAAALVIFLVVVSFKMHNFWAMTDPMMRMTEMVSFMKNMGLLGGALMTLAIPMPWPWSVLL